MKHLPHPLITADPHPKWPQSNRNKNHNGKQTAKDFPDSKVEIHEHASLGQGSPCIYCTGTLYFHNQPNGQPRSIVFFTASSPITPTVHEFHDLRCNLCKAVIKVSPPQELVDDDFGTEERFGYSAISMIAIMKYFKAIPLYRIAGLEAGFSIHPLMVDGSCQNEVTVTDAVKLICNQHARDKFKKCRRVLYRKEHSKPIFSELERLVIDYKQQKIAPDNSDFGGL